jgi:4-amino-4-deoxy-L-arabinose transferase-like glycosyltransferase
MTARRTLVALVGATVLCLLLFIDKAFHVDDVLFLHVAEQITRSAGDFYGFEINWRDTVEPIHGFTMNPPLTGYYLAAAGFLFGRSEIALHLAFLLPAVLLVLGGAKLARACGASAGWTGAMMLATPAFLVSATSVMSDVLLASLYVWAVVLWVQGVDEGHAGCVIAAAFLALAAVMTRYFAVSLIPLLAAYAIVKRGGLGWSLLLLLLPVLGLVAYDQYTTQRYGEPLFWNALGFPRHAHEASGETLPLRLLSGLTFLGGGVLIAAFLIPVTATRRSGFVWLLAFLLVSVVIVFFPKTAGYESGGEGAWLRAVQFALFVCSGVMLLGTTWIMAVRRKDAKALLLALWIFGTFGFCTVVNWTVNVRSFLPALPALCVVLTMGTARWHSHRNRALCAALLIAGMSSLAVAASDYRWANSARRVARELCRDTQDGDAVRRFSGHWGFQYYMERGGARAIDYRRDTFRMGDRIVVPEMNTGVFPFPPENLRLLRRVVIYPWLNFGTSASLQLMNERQGVGFYTSVWGPLPFAITPRTAQGYHVFELRRAPAGAGE